MPVSPAPDETTVCKFRHLLERHELCGRIFAEVNAYLAQQGIQIGTGTIVDATILQAPSSTKNAARQRDPEMHQVRKGKQWYFGMKAHVGVDAATAANVADSRVLGQLLHGEETEIWGDQAYQGQNELIRQHAPKATDRSTGAGAASSRALRSSGSKTVSSPRPAPASSMSSP